MPHRAAREGPSESSHKYTAFVLLMQGVFETIFRFFTKILLVFYWTDGKKKRRPQFLETAFLISQQLRQPLCQRYVSNG